MAKLRNDNEEVSGDEYSEEEEDTGMGDVDVESGPAIIEWKGCLDCYFYLEQHFPDFFIKLLAVVK